MKIFKNTLAIILVCLTIMVLIACASKEKTPPATTAATTPTTTVTSSVVTTSSTVTTAAVTEPSVTTTGVYDYLSEYEPVLPKASVAPTKLIRINPSGNDGETLASVSLQGLLAKNGSSELVVVEYGQEVKNYISTVRKNYDCEISNSSIWLLVKKYADPSYGYINGYILTDIGDESVNVATSLASQLNALIVTEEFVNKVEFYGLTCLADVRNYDDEWLRQSEYFDKLSKDVAFICNVKQNVFLRDYCIMSGSYCFSDATTSSSAIANALDFMNDNFVVFGWNNNCGEYGTVEAISSKNGCLIPADYASNLSVWSAFRLSSALQITEEVKSDGQGKHTVVFILSDGDNLQWTLGNYSTSTKWYANENRGDFYMGWGLPACLVDSAPPTLQYYYSHMTPKDQFILELSGVGYTFPSKWQNTASLRDMYADLATLMERMDMSYVEILDTMRFSRLQVDKYYTMLMKQDQVKGAFYIDYGNYAAYGGSIIWNSDKPIVSARYKLWAGATTVEELAASINNSSTDPTNADAYTFVTVHAWSGLNSNGQLVADGNTHDAIAAVIALLDDDVDVVTPEEFMKRIIENEIGKK